MASYILGTGRSVCEMLLRGRLFFFFYVIFLAGRFQSSNLASSRTLLTRVGETTRRGACGHPDELRKSRRWRKRRWKSRWRQQQRDACFVATSGEARMPSVLSFAQTVGWCLFCCLPASVAHARPPRQANSNKQAASHAHRNKRTHPHSSSTPLAV